jgi:hypothetical protein
MSPIQVAARVTKIMISSAVPSLLMIHLYFVV